MRKLSLLLAILTFAFVFVTYTGTSAHAATVKYNRTVQIGLSVDCSHLPTSAKARQIIARYKLCSQGKISRDSSITSSLRKETQTLLAKPLYNTDYIFPVFG